VPGQPAAVEACNGVDDDCDGQTDEGFPSLTCGEGACRVTRVACTGGSPSDCVPLPAGVEVCNGVDDDCDGATDEGFGPVTCGLGTCSNTVDACRNGVPQTCSPLPPASAEACNGADDDCDGATDEELGSLSCGVGACAVSGPACVDGAPVACVPLPKGVEACNGQDDDCDGATDEGLGSLACGQGVCATSVTACVAGVPQACTPLPLAKAEACNGADDDCDGVVDEGLGTLNCGKGACANTVDACRNGVAQACTPLPLAAPEKCNGADDDCDGAIDEDLGTVTCGLGVCAATTAACVGGVPPTCVPNWAAQVAETCNGKDDDCDGQTDEGMGGSWCVRYEPIDSASPALDSAQLVAALHALVTNGAVAFPYDQARKKLYVGANGIDADASNTVVCVYTGRTETFPNGYSATDPAALSTCKLADGSPCPGCDVAAPPGSCGFNTEHAWPQYWLKAALGGATSPAFLTAQGDLHHLFPTWSVVNSVRSNFYYGDTACVVGGSPSCNWPDTLPDEPSHLGPTAIANYAGTTVFEPRAERRGDVARAWFYVSVRYLVPIDDRIEAVLRAWHQADPPDQRELDRNAGVDALQKNRNPFVDRPGYVGRILDF
jgi:hypothetical protein